MKRSLLFSFLLLAGSLIFVSEDTSPEISENSEDKLQEPPLRLIVQIKASSLSVDELLSDLKEDKESAKTIFGSISNINSVLGRNPLAPPRYLTRR